MPRHNSHITYGSVTKTFHWLTALLILSAIPLGLIGVDLAHRIEAGETALIDRAALIFSLHKTIGIAAFLTALGRILWALGQPRPGLLHGERRAEATLAGTVHWLLYGAMLITPLSGWVHHAATTGFAPIWWPFGQTLPFVPQSMAVAEAATTVHFLASRVLIVTILLHVAGALKHHLIDRDDTLRRMLPRGRVDQSPSVAQPGHALPLVLASAVWLSILGAGAAPALMAPGGATAPAASQSTAGNWQVEDGTLSLSITQMGNTVNGSFAAWTAEIAFADDPAQQVNGEVQVEIVISSLTLGSVTAQAMGADMAYIGSPFIATDEARAVDAYKQMIVDSEAKDIVYSNYFTGIPGNYLKPSIAASGMDPENLPVADPSKMNFDTATSGPKAWKEIWGCGQGIGAVKKIGPVADLVDRLESEYKATRQRLAL